MEVTSSLAATKQNGSSGDSAPASAGRSRLDKTKTHEDEQRTTVPERERPERSFAGYARLSRG